MKSGQAHGMPRGSPGGPSALFDSDFEKKSPNTL